MEGIESKNPRLHVEQVALYYVKMAFSKLLKPEIKALLKERLKVKETLSEQDIVNINLTAHDIADFVCQEVSEGALRRYKYHQNKG